MDTILFSSVICVLLLFIVKSCFGRKSLKKELNEQENMRDSLITAMQWIENQANGKPIAPYLISHGYKRIAIYGTGEIGLALGRELLGSAVTVQYFIDRNAEGLSFVDLLPPAILSGGGEPRKIPVVGQGEKARLREVDAIVVPPPFPYNAVNSALIRDEIDIPTVSLKDLLFEM